MHSIKIATFAIRESIAVMKIDFGKIEEKPLEKFKGGMRHMDARIFDDGSVKIMKNRLQPGATIGKHTHADSCEAIFVLSGYGKAITDGAEEALAPGDCTYCPKGSEHELINTGDEDFCFYAIVPQL